MFECRDQFSKRAPTAWEGGVSWFLHRWPLLSGCGTVASSKLVCKLVPRSPDAVWGKVNGLPCLVPLNDLVGRAIFLVGDLDRKVKWVLDRTVHEGDSVLDVGANMGLVSLQMASLVGNTGRVLAFEPSPSVLPFLHATLDANADQNIELLTCALGRRESRLTLIVPEHNAGRASLVPGLTDGIPFEVEVRPLAAVLAERGVERIDVMKIDVEGFEYEVLLGLFGDHAAPRPEVILFEENEPRNSRTFAVLREAGYRLFGLPRRSFLTITLIAEGSAGFFNCHDYVALSFDLSTEKVAALGLPAA